MVIPFSDRNSQLCGHIESWEKGTKNGGINILDYIWFWTYCFILQVSNNAVKADWRSQLCGHIERVDRHQNPWQIRRGCHWRLRRQVIVNVFWKMPYVLGKVFKIVSSYISEKIRNIWKYLIFCTIILSNSSLQECQCNWNLLFFELITNQGHNWWLGRVGNCTSSFKTTLYLPLVF